MRVTRLLVVRHIVEVVQLQGLLRALLDQGECPEEEKFGEHRGCGFDVRGVRVFFVYEELFGVFGRFLKFAHFICIIYTDQRIIKRSSALLNSQYCDSFMQ